MAAAEEQRGADMVTTTGRPTTQVRSRVSPLGTHSGLQTYPKNAPDTLLLDGEVLVLDVALLPEPTVHASYADLAAEGHHCPAMDAFSRLVSDVSERG
jgi:hypothetical protein